ncbi:MAG TPA: TIGR02281 family clan AA aspartic protease [Allosphingosinicella sp.]|nr:TIGR02281 family clan AA aspartic protease [Allosphingosinicella sp.]
MPTTISPEWQQMALYALGAALLLMVLSRLPFVGRLVRFAVSLALLGFFIFILMQQAPYQPQLAGVMASLGLDKQEVVGREVRIRMAADGHFWARAKLNGVERRMLIDSGATMTTISDKTAAAAAVEARAGLAPVLLRTANGVAKAETGTLDDLRLGSITARELRIIIAPGLGDVDIIGMNFLSKLESWRVEGRTLVLVPKRA